MIISFIGHSLLNIDDRARAIIKNIIKSRICGSDSVAFYLGGYGNFDEACASVCRELKEEFTCVDIVYVTPYFDLPAQRKIKEMQRCGLYDSYIYPPIENTPPKFAILKRNEWMIS